MEYRQGLKLKEIPVLCMETLSFTNRNALHSKSSWISHVDFLRGHWLQVTGSEARLRLQDKLPDAPMPCVLGLQPCVPSLQPWVELYLYPSLKLSLCEGTNLRTACLSQQRSVLLVRSKVEHKITWGTVTVTSMTFSWLLLNVWEPPKTAMIKC